MITIVADENIPFLQGALEPFAKLRYMPGRKISNLDLKDADGLIVRTRTICDRRLLEGTRVGFIATATIGHDHIDDQFCREKGIAWHAAAGCNASAVFQYMASALVHLSMKNDIGLKGKTLGVIGVGHVGRRVVELGQLLGMNVLRNDPPRARIEGDGQFVGLQRIQEESDIITIHVPLSMEGPESTYQLVDEDFLIALKKKPFIINTSRGQVIDEDALKHHLKNGSVRGCILDVWKGEPAIDEDLLGMALLGTPHIAGYSTEGKANGAAICVRQASRHFGFGIDDWYPESLPAPTLNEIVLDTAGRSIREILHDALVFGYDVEADNYKLKEAPDRFEDIRNTYPVRREFQAYTIRLVSPHPSAEKVLKGLGFNMISGL